MRQFGNEGALEAVGCVQVMCTVREQENGEWDLASKVAYGRGVTGMWRKQRQDNMQTQISKDNKQDTLKTNRNRTDHDNNNNNNNNNH